VYEDFQSNLPLAIIFFLLQIDCSSLWVKKVHKCFYIIFLLRFESRV
jgi:hypothetical protein